MVGGIIMTIEERADAYIGHPEEIDEFTSETIKEMHIFVEQKSRKPLTLTMLVLSYAAMRVHIK